MNTGKRLSEACPGDHQLRRLWAPVAQRGETEGVGLEHRFGGSHPVGVTGCVTLHWLLDLSVCCLAHLHSWTSKGTQSTGLHEGKLRNPPRVLTRYACRAYSVCSVQLLSRVRLFEAPWTAARQASLSIANSRSLLKLMSIE